MMTGLMQDQNLEKQIEKQIGCMSGFLHIFDRQQILAGKRIYSTKRLPPATGAAASPESDKSVQSTVIGKLEKPVVTSPESPANLNVFPVFELEGSVKSSWKFCKEMPRLSLDSRATVDSKGSLCRKEVRQENGSFDKQRRSPSVIARLMGVEQLPSSGSLSTETVEKPVLRRSASESRVSRDLFRSRFIDGDNFQAKQNQTNRKSVETNLTNKNNLKYSSRNQKNESPQKRRSFFDSADIFPEQKKTTVRIYGDSEKNLTLRGKDEQWNDLETLKHILEAMQLKGLLHSKRSLNRHSRSFVYDHSYLSDDLNAVLMNRWRSPPSNRRFGNDYGRVNRYSGEISPSVSPRKEREAFDRSGRSPVRARIEFNSKNCRINNKRIDESSESRRNSPINSPNRTPKRTGFEHHSFTNRSPRSNRPTEMVNTRKKISRTVVADDESSSFSESSGSTTSQSDPQRSKMEEYGEGKSLLARCDKLLHSIAEMNIMTESHTRSNSVIPSPISVLDSAFDQDESSSPSPVMKRTIDFSDLTVDLEDDIWSSIISPATSTVDEEFISGDSDFTYISEILRASKYHPVDTSIFYYLENQQYLTGDDSSNGSKLRRKLVFDVVAEILDRNRELPPWNSISLTESNNSVKQICSEFQKIREPETAENLLDLICAVLKRDLAGNNGWEDQPVEISEAVLYIERLIFKDLVSETIRDLAEFAGKTTFFAPRRKLVF
ncbi:hypothetical protein L1987_60321 [Smallanthus sonchifolius]|uniref:Uncharacterized protein n=1 Tax=Smallanthus sonchifolius TaxID=185202 RepID=A0ACB9D8K6_9ASTR|nr:hypothetical protein L1987_60321 [Smallanthus sonchifolius]